MKIEVNQHGDFYTPKVKELTCPDCGAPTAPCGEEKYTDWEWAFLGIFKNAIYKQQYKCPVCNCEFERVRKKIQDIDGEEVIKLLFLLFGIFGIASILVFFILGFVIKDEDASASCFAISFVSLLISPFLIMLGVS